jgi:hypothetical protein
MIIGNSVHHENLIHDFPEIHKSNKTLYMFDETIRFGNWKSVVVDNIETFKKYDKLIINNWTEAPYINCVNNTIKLLKENNITDVLYVDGGLTNSFKFKSVYYPGFFCTSNDEIISAKNRLILYISLARLSSGRFNRIAFTYELYKNNLLPDGIVTCGCSQEKWGYDGLDLFPSDFKKIMPLCYDGIVNSKEASYPYLTFGRECLINIVQETSFDPIRSEDNPIMYFGEGQIWNRPFFTEKTAKAFNAGQIPLFVTVSGYVNILKHMGFDIFDDIVDHSYDYELNPDERIKMVAKELLRLKNIGLERLKNIYRLDERFLYNKNLLSNLIDNMTVRYKQIVNTWFFS